MEFYSNGKLLITGEYVVLDGAKSLALPTKFGQNLIVKTIKNNEKYLVWESIDSNDKTWFKCKFNIRDFEILNTCFKTNEVAKTLQSIFIEVKKLNPKFLNPNHSFYIKTKLTFNKNWGLGSSSTLINNIANWAKVDPFKLQFKIFGGSAYDIACAKNNEPIIYQLQNNKPVVNKIKFNPEFKDKLFFIYLNKKKNSRIAIKNYRNNAKNASNLARVSTITSEIIATKLLFKFEELITEHEQIISDLIKIKPIKEQFFKDYFGVIKSLGAWEGDFILATGNKSTPNYFKNKGYNTVITYNDMIF